MFTDAQRRAVFRRDECRCQLGIKCSREKVKWDDWHCDHRLAWTEGGKTTVENGCAACNLAKGKARGVDDGSQREVRCAYGARSSAGKSSRFLTDRSQVRILPGAPSRAHHPPPISSMHNRPLSITLETASAVPWARSFVNSTQSRPRRRRIDAEDSTSPCRTSWP